MLSGVLSGYVTMIDFCGCVAASATVMKTRMEKTLSFMLLVFVFPVFEIYGGMLRNKDGGGSVHQCHYLVPAAGSAAYHHVVNVTPTIPRSPVDPLLYLLEIIKRCPSV